MKKAVIVGANMGYTHSGMKLNDGGCCILHNGQIIAIAEWIRVLPRRNEH